MPAPQISPPFFYSTHHPPVMAFRIPFAGEGEFPTPDSVLSHSYGALLPMFDTVEATVLRQLCKEFKSTVADFPWEDEKTVIHGSVAAWRACFPRARCANVRQFYKGGRRTFLVDADFVHFVGVRRLNMSGCRSVTDAAFVHLKGIHTLDMAGCSLGEYYANDVYVPPNITDAAFAHLKGIHTLNMSGCSTCTITNAAFVHLKGIHTLNMAWCRQTAITDAAFAHLKGIHSLSLFGCTQLTSAVFTHLKGIMRLNIGLCRKLTLTDEDEYLTGVEWLGMYDHSQAQVLVAESLGYPVDQRVVIGTWL